MPTFSAVQAANLDLRKRSNTATAVFTGATNGIGLATLRSFVRHIPKPTMIVAGRNRQAFEDKITELKQINSNLEITFIQADLSLIKNIDSVAEQIAARLPARSVDFLSMSQGYAPLEGRQYTSEGLDKAIAVFYYGRLRLLQNLITSKILKPDATVLNVLAGGKEGMVREDDLALDKNYSIMNLRTQISCMLTLSHDALGKQHPELKLLHVYPGTVDTGLLTRSVQSWWLWLVLLVVDRFIMLFNRAMSEEESGERMLDLALSERFGKGSHSMLEQGDLSRSKWLAKYRADGTMAEKVWEFNEGVWAKALRGQ